MSCLALLLPTWSNPNVHLRISLASQAFASFRGSPSSGEWRGRAALSLLLVGLAAPFAAGCSGSVQVKANSEGDLSGQSSAEGESTADGPKGRMAPNVVRSGPPLVTFPSFEVLTDGRSVVTVQVSGPTEVSEQKNQGRIVYFLRGVGVPEKVNRLPLVSANFPTQVSRVQIEQGNGGANVVLELREDATPTHKVEKIEGGTLLTITLPRSEKFGDMPGRGKVDDQDANWEEGGSTTSDGHHRGKKHDDDGDGKTATNDEEPAKKRWKRGIRQPIPFVQRHITLSYRTLAPDVSVSVWGAGKQDVNVFLMSGVRYGIVDQFEIEATPHAFRLTPEGGYFAPSFGATWNFIQTAFDMGVRARFFIPVDSGQPGAKGTSVLSAGLPMIIHLGSYAKIDTGVNVTAAFASKKKVGLYEQTASPFMQEPGIPLKFVFQPDEALFLGAGSGFSLFDFDQKAESIAIPLSFRAGVTTSSKKKPAADFGVDFQWPEFATPASKAHDKVHEDVFELGFWLRWYYYI